MPGIFKHGEAFVGAVEEDDSCTQHFSRSDKIGIYDVSDADHDEDQHLFEDALEADFTGQIFICDGAHDAGNVVGNNKRQEGVEETVKATDKPSEKAAKRSKTNLDPGPNFFHFDHLQFVNLY